MYNAELKERFMREMTTGTSYAYETLFNQTSELESVIQKDLGEFSREQILEHVNLLQHINYQSVYAHIMVINKYCKWYSEQTGFVDPDWTPIDVQKDIDFVTACKNKLYTSFDEILKAFYSIDYDFHCGDEAAPAICLAWLGFKVPQILALPNACVNLKKGCIVDESGSIIVNQIPDDILQILRDYKDVKESYRILNGKQKVFQLDTGYFIHKMIRPNSKRGGKVESGHLYARIDEAKEAYEAKYGVGTCKFSPLEQVWTSGCFYRLHQLEKNGFDIYDKENFAMLQKVLQGSENRMYGARYVYTQYKKAFNLE